MPTIHLSIPDNLYRDLRNKSAETGIHVTDLIRMYTIQGLRYGFDSGADKEFIEELNSKLSDIEKTTSEKLTRLEGKYYELLELVNYLFKRVDTIQEIVESRISLIPKEKIGNIDIS